MKSKYSAVPSIWALACAAAMAQQTPPETKPAEEEKPAPNYPKLDLGWGTWGLRGNESVFRRFATMPSGLFIKNLSYGYYESSPGLFGEVSFRGRPDEDFVTETTNIFGPRLTRLQTSFTSSEFMRPSVGMVDESRRRTLEGSIKQPLGAGLDLVLDFASRQNDKVLEGPAFPAHSRTQNFGARLAREVGKDGRLELSLSDLRFFDRTNLQPDSHAQTWQGSFLQPIGVLALEGSYAQTSIEQDGRSDAKVRHWNLDGLLPIGSDFDLQFGMRRQTYELPQVANAYVRERLTSYARLVGYWEGVSGHLSYKHVETERVREDHLFVDVPKFNTLEGRLSGDFGSGPRWTIRGSWQNLDGDATMLTSDPRRLFWDDRVKLQFKLDHGGTDWGAYAAYNFGLLENQMREIKVRTHGFVAGGTYQWKRNVDFFGEVSMERANTDFTEPNATVGLDSFFPSSRVITLGSNWAISPNTSLTASFTELATDNDNPIFDPLGNVYSRFISATVNHKTKDGCELSFTFAPGRYADRAIRQLGYQATVVQLAAKWRF